MIRLLLLVVVLLSQSCQALKFDFSDSNCLMFSTEVMKCKGRSIQLSQSKTFIDQMRNQKLTKIKRQPYLLVRRLFVTEQLYQAVQAIASNSPQASEEKEKFCNMIGKQDPKERTYVMNNGDFKGQFCSSDLALSKKSGMLALSYSVQEVDFLYRFIKKYTSTGTVKFRFKTKVPSRTMHAKILIQKAAILSTVVDRSSVIAKGSKLNSCENPGWGSSWFPGKNTKDCGGEVNPTLITDYLMDSALGETSFVFSKGRGKLIRLFEDAKYSVEIFSTIKQPYIVADQPFEVKELEWKASRRVYSL